MEYPDAPRLDLVEELHGHRVADPYRWLEDADDPRTKEWSQRQDDLVAAQRTEWTARAEFRERVESLMGAGVIGGPIWRGDRRFFTRREPGQEHAVLLVVEADGAERILVDPMALDPAGTTTLDQWQPSIEGDRLAYRASSGGTEESSVFVLDVATGELVEGPIDRTRSSSTAWLPGGEEYFYARHQPGEEGIHHRRVYRHRVGTDPETDELVFGEGAERAAYFGMSTSRDGRWLLVSMSRGTDPRNDLWVADLHGEGTFTPVQQNVDAQAYARVVEGRMYLWTDRDAPRGRICVVDPAAPDRWETLIPEDPEAVLTDSALILGAGLLAVAWRRHAVGELTLHDARTGALVSTVELPGLGTITELVARPEGGDEVWFGFETYGQPERILQWSAATGEVTVFAVSPGEVTPPEIEVRQVTYPSKDGTPVRMFVLSPAGGTPAVSGRSGAEPAVKRPDLGGTSPRPTILYGYGGFNISLVPQFWPLALAWIAAGGTYAVASLRGGSEEGEQWHRAGMLAAKQNVFDDFHAAADWLVESGIASQVGCYGGSNGGLLVGAAATQRPERFAAVVCSAPLLDMLRYEAFGLGPNWSGEYGSAEDPEQFGWLLGYSPYHRVVPGTAYPAVLFTVFEGDTRVDPLHARKTAAAMQHATTSDRPILIRRETGVGHSSRAVSRAVDLNADVLGFLAWALRG